jgi:uncharacterized protein (DUF1778 family)
MTTARIEVRIDDSDKLTLERAAAVSGAKSLTEYILKHMLPVAQSDIANAAVTVLPSAKFDEFIAACDHTEAPNQALIDAFEASKTMGRSVHL